jgi:hypothetical protein
VQPMSLVTSYGDDGDERKQQQARRPGRCVWT